MPPVCPVKNLRARRAASPPKTSHPATSTGKTLRVRPGPTPRWTFSLTAPVTLDGPGGDRGALCLALRGDRAFVATDAVLSPGSTLRLTLRDPTERTAMTFRARVTDGPAAPLAGLWLHLERCELNDDDLISAARHLHA